MAEIQVQVFHAQAFQCLVAGLDHVLARQPALGRLGVLHRTEVDLAGHAIAVAREAQVGQHVAHHPLGFAMVVDLGVVEEIDAVVVGQRQQFARLGTPHLLAEGDPGAERQRGQLQAGMTKATVLHGEILHRYR